MNSNVKTKVLAQALVITLLLALQSNAKYQIVRYTDCGPDSTRLSNVEIEYGEDRWSIEGDVIYGSNDSVVHTINITRHYCHDMLPCENRKPVLVVKDVLCGSPNIESTANETCQIGKDIIRDKTLVNYVRDYYGNPDLEFCIKYVETSMVFDTYMDAHPRDDPDSGSEWDEEITER